MMRSVKTVKRAFGVATIAFGLAMGLNEGTGGRGMDFLGLNGNGGFVVDEAQCN